MQRPRLPYLPLKPIKPEKYVNNSSNYLYFDREASIGDIIDKFKELFPDITEEEICDITIDIDYNPSDYSEDRIEAYLYRESKIPNSSYIEEMKIYEAQMKKYDKLLERI